MRMHPFFGLSQGRPRSPRSSNEFFLGSNSASRKTSLYNRSPSTINRMGSSRSPGKTRSFKKSSPKLEPIIMTSGLRVFVRILHFHSYISKHIFNLFLLKQRKWWILNNTSITGKLLQEFHFRRLKYHLCKIPWYGWMVEFLDYVILNLLKWNPCLSSGYENEIFK